MHALGFKLGLQEDWCNPVALFLHVVGLCSKLGFQVQSFCRRFAALRGAGLPAFATRWMKAEVRRVVLIKHTQPLRRSIRLLQVAAVFGCEPAELDLLHCLVRAAATTIAAAKLQRDVPIEVHMLSVCSGKRAEEEVQKLDMKAVPQPIIDIFRVLDEGNEVCSLWEGHAKGQLGEKSLYHEFRVFVAREPEVSCFLKVSSPQINWRVFCKSWIQAFRRHLPKIFSTPSRALAPSVPSAVSTSALGPLVTRCGGPPCFGG